MYFSHRSVHPRKLIPTNPHGIFPVGAVAPITFIVPAPIVVTVIITIIQFFLLYYSVLTLDIEYNLHVRLHSITSMRIPNSGVSSLAERMPSKMF